MEVQLSEKQVQLIQATINEQELLKSQAQAEFNKLQKRLDDLVLLVLDTKGISPVQGIRYQEGKLIIPEVTPELIEE